MNRTMNRNVRNLLLNLFLYGLLLILLGCSVFKPNFDRVGHQNAVKIREDALALMDRAHGSFGLHRTAVYRLMTRVERAYEHARPLYKNGTIIALWDGLRDPRSNRLGRFMVEWEKEDILDPDYIKEIKALVDEDFQLLIQLEEKKEK